MIRPARPEDAPAICAIWNRIIRETSLTFTTAEKDETAIASQIGVVPFFVAERLSKPVGFVTYDQFRAGPGYARTVEHSVHIAEGARGAGLGRALMDTAHARAKADGIHCFVAGIAGENPDGVRFHEALGYAPVARLPEVGWKFDRWHDLVLMQKFL